MRAAVQFLTILPVRAPHVAPGQPALWFPWAGAGIGMGVALASFTPFPGVTALLAAVVLTGGLHEDGLADVCDALRAGRSRERMHQILKDSRIGTYGALAIGLSLLARWQALDRLAGAHVWLTVPFAFALARAAMVALAAATPAAGEGLGRAFRQSLPRGAAWGVALPLIAAAYFVPHGWWALAAAALTIVFCRAWFLARLGGVTGDCLGFQAQLAEASALLVLAWR